MRKMQETPELDKLIEFGSSGHLPLFFQDWIIESFADSKDLGVISFSRAAETVHRVYGQIQIHQSIEKKKTAIQAMGDAQRREFILSFMKMVEYRVLDKVRELH
jgi:hypothetical protein